MCEQFQDLKQVLEKTIPGGVGGPITGGSYRSKTEEKRKELASTASESMSMQRELHSLQVNELKCRESEHSANAPTKIMQMIRKQLKLKKEFDELGDQQMVDTCAAQVVILKAQLGLLPQQPATEGSPFTPSPQIIQQQQHSSTPLKLSYN
jgi:hypothetical protein